MKRGEVAEAVAREIDARGAKVVADPWGAGLAVADRLGLKATAESKGGGSWLFVRQTDDVPPEVAARFDGVIVAGRIYRSGKVRLANQSVSWFAQVQAAGARVAVFDWMLPADRWADRLDASVVWAASVGAEALCLNVEPRPKGHSGARWEDHPEQAEPYARAARRACEARGMALWFSSWATLRKRPSFPVRPFVDASSVCIPQPYEVHHPGGPEYVRDVISEWQEYGAREVWIGRGAHMLDRIDGKTRSRWRTPEEIAAHRQSTPAGAVEVWWPPAGSLARRPAVVDAMVSEL